MHVFVYGTLTEPDRVDRVLAGPSTSYDLAKEATLEGLRRVEGEYPTLAPGGSVEGRLLSVDETALERLDRYEGVDSGLYERVEIPLEGDEGSVWTYVGDPDRLGVDGVAWPGDGSFRERVRSLVARDEIVVSTHE